MTIALSAIVVNLTSARSSPTAVPPPRITSSQLNAVAQPIHILNPGSSRRPRQTARTPAHGRTSERIGRIRRTAPNAPTGAASPATPPVRRDSTPCGPTHTAPGPYEAVHSRRTALPARPLRVCRGTPAGVAPAAAGGSGKRPGRDGRKSPSPGNARNRARGGGIGRPGPAIAPRSMSLAHRAIRRSCLIAPITGARMLPSHTKHFRNAGEQTLSPRTLLSRGTAGSPHLPGVRAVRPN
jgi:hypothetical protein